MNFKNLFFYILIVTLMFSSCKKVIYDEYKYGIRYWYYNDEQIDIKGYTLYVKSKMNEKFRYQIYVSDNGYISNIYDSLASDGTVLTFSFIGDTLYELETNQQVIFDSTCFILWGADVDNNSYERKELIKTGNLCIIERNWNGYPAKVSFKGITEQGNKIELITNIYAFYNPEIYQVDQGQFLYKDTMYLLSRGYYSWIYDTRKHAIHFHHSDYKHHTYHTLGFIVYNNGSTSFTGDYYSKNENPSHYFTSRITINKDFNSSVRDFNDGHISIENDGCNYHVTFELIDLNDTVRGSWSGAFLEE